MIPWNEDGDFVVECIERMAEEKGGTISSISFDAIHQYFTHRTTDEFYKSVMKTIREEDFLREHRPDGKGVCSRLSCHVCVSRRGRQNAGDQGTA